MRLRKHGFMWMCDEHPTPSSGRKTKMARKRTTKSTKGTNVDIGDDLVIARKTRRLAAGGTWVSGTLNGHRFDCLVFSEHAEWPDYELGDSRISKLWLKSLGDHRVVANFDRGWDLRPTTKTAQAIVDFLAAGLADYVYHT
jgi:hypothetical protein